MVYVALACRGLTGVVFGVSAFSKLRSRAAFRDFRWWLAALPVPVARRWPGPVAVVMAAAEVVIVVLLALPQAARAGLVLAAATLAVFTAGTWLAVARGADKPCQCFGASASPLARRHVVRDALLCAAAAAGALAAGGQGGHAAGVVLSLAAGLVLALFVVFLDDLVALFAAPADTSPDVAGAGG